MQAIESNITPEYYWLNLVEHCNNDCHWCYAGSGKASTSYMRISNVKSIIDEMARLGAKECLLIGGEPTLHPEIADIVEYGKSKSQKMILVTNGRALSSSNYLDSLVHNGLDTVNISIHGWDDESYFNNTGAKSGFKQLEKAVNNAIKTDLEITGTLVLSSYVFPHIETVLTNINNLGIKTLIFNVTTPTLEKDGNIDEDSMVIFDDMPEMIMKAVSLCDQFKIRGVFNLTIPHCLLTPNQWDRILKNHSVISGCSLRSGNGVVFKTDGGITVCNHLLDFEAANSTDSDEIIKTGRFKEFWNAKELTEVRDHASSYQSEECSKCARWEICGAGCPIFWMTKDPLEYNFKPTLELNYET